HATAPERCPFDETNRGRKGAEPRREPARPGPGQRRPQTPPRASPAAASSGRSRPASQAPPCPPESTARRGRESRERGRSLAGDLACRQEFDFCVIALA